MCPYCGASEDLEFIGEDLDTKATIAIDGVLYRVQGKWCQIGGNEIVHDCKER